MGLLIDEDSAHYVHGGRPSVKGTSSCLVADGRNKCLGEGGRTESGIRLPCSTSTAVDVVTNPIYDREAVQLRK